jgi:hypothetical protein
MLKQFSADTGVCGGEGYVQFCQVMYFDIWCQNRVITSFGVMDRMMSCGILYVWAILYNSSFVYSAEADVFCCKMASKIENNEFFCTGWCEVMYSGTIR